jgi:hypothetical protein
MTPATITDEDIEVELLQPSLSEVQDDGDVGTADDDGDDGGGGGDDDGGTDDGGADDGGVDDGAAPA